MRLNSFRLASLLSAIFLMPFASWAQGTAFTYQGQLTDGGNAANGIYDLTFSVFDASTNGNLIGSTITNPTVGVSGGLFATNLDFGRIFTGTNYWLGIGVRTNGSTNAYTALWPRQAVLPTPYAIFANTASNLIGTLTATQLVGTLPASAFSGYTNTVSLTNTANLFSGTFTGTFSGNGASLTNLNGSNIVSGTVADARLSGNVAFLNGTQTFTGANAFTNWGNSFTGSFYGNGLVGWNVATGTNVNATIDAGFVLTASNLMNVTLPTPLHVGDIVRISGAGTGGWRVIPPSGQTIYGNFLSYSNSIWTVSDAPSSSWYAMACSADGSKMAAASVGTPSEAIYLSTDYGQNWSASGSSSSVWRCVAISADGSRLIAGQGSSGSLYYSTNSGASWTGGSGSSGENWYCAAMSANGSNAVAGSSGGGVFTSVNGGVSWVQRTSAPTASNYWGVASSSDGSKLVAVIYGGQIYTSSNYGTNWTKQGGAPTANWTAVASSADGSKLAATANGSGIYTSGDYGVTWIQQTSAPAIIWYGITSSSDGGKLAAVAYGSGVYVSDNFGVNWVQQRGTTNTPNSWAAICGSADGSRLAAAVNGGSIYYSSATTQNSSGGSISGPQGSAVELQYIGNNQWMPVSSTGTIWAN